MKLWRVLGVAGLAGVAATGAIIARDQRKRAQMTPDEVRSRLRERLDDSQRAPGSAAEAAAESAGDGDPHPGAH